MGAEAPQEDEEKLLGCQVPMEVALGRGKEGFESEESGPAATASGHGGPDSPAGGPALENQQRSYQHHRQPGINT